MESVISGTGQPGCLTVVPSSNLVDPGDLGDCSTHLNDQVVLLQPVFDGKSNGVGNFRNRSTWLPKKSTKCQFGQSPRSW